MHSLLLLVSKNKYATCLGSFILRVFSRKPVIVEAVDKLHTSVQSGSWTKDSAGGSLRITVDGQHRENNKWCQNPQYHFNLANIFNKEELHLKIVVRRTDLNPTIKVCCYIDSLTKMGGSHGRLDGRGEGDWR